MKHKIGLFIFRRDLRIEDNTALNYAHNLCEKVIPIFIFTHEQVERNPYKSENAVLFMIETLEELEETIRAKGGWFYTFYDKSHNVVQHWIERYDEIEAVFVNQDYSLYSKERDKRIKNVCERNSVSFYSCHDICLYPPQSIRTTTDEVYSKFTPFYRNAIEREVPIPHTLRKMKFDTIQRRGLKKRITLKDAKNRFTVENNHLEVRGGRSRGIKRLRNSEFDDYDKTRDYFERDTSKLSGYIKFGALSIREVYHFWNKKYGRDSGLVRQLLWRDFYFHLLDDNKRLMKGKSFRQNYDRIRWENNPSLIKAWKEGKTGFPIVDACMRHLNQNGYMHNRGRLIVSSFLIKTLLVDWRIGEMYFATRLLDYDPAANNGNWQWMSGSGADSQPYFRIFNPFSQGQRYDKDATFIKKWVPELKNVESKDIHQWDKKYTSYPDLNYPNPIVDFSTQREKALSLYKNVV